MKKTIIIICACALILTAALTAAAVVYSVKYKTLSDSIEARQIAVCKNITDDIVSYNGGNEDAIRLIKTELYTLDTLEIAKITDGKLHTAIAQCRYLTEQYPEAAQAKLDTLHGALYKAIQRNDLSELADDIAAYNEAVAAYSTDE